VLDIAQSRRVALAFVIVSLVTAVGLAHAQTSAQPSVESLKSEIYFGSDLGGAAKRPVRLSSRMSWFPVSALVSP
jgi:hypothetical protein